MNLGGGKSDFMTAKEKIPVYKKRLQQEFAAMAKDRDLIGLTELNPNWYDWLVQQPWTHPFKSVHDGHDVAIFWDTSKFERKDPNSPPTVTKIFDSHELGALTQAAQRLDWRTFIAVELKYILSPPVVITAACTHTHRNSKSKSGPRNTDCSAASASAFHDAGLSSME